MQQAQICIGCKVARSVQSSPRMAHLLGNLAASAAAHWKRSLLLVLAVLVTLGVLASTVGGSFTDDFSAPGTESQRALDLLDQRFPAQSGDTATVVFSVESGTLRGGDRPQAIAKAIDEIKGQPHVTAAVDPLSAEGRGQVSRDGRIAFATVQYDQPAMDLGKGAGERLEEAGALAERDGVEVARRGQVVDQAEQQTAPVGELIGIAVSVLVLTLVFRSVAAMLLTLFASLLALVGGIMLLTLGSAVIDFPSFAPTLGVMLGLGAGIDYALLIVGRYREQLATGDDVPRAARVANQTAGTSIVAAGSIVVVAISGLLATGLPFVGRMGLGSAIMVATVAVGAVTVLPVLMGAFARRLRPRRPEHVAPSAAFSRWGSLLTRRPWIAAGAGALILVVLASPFASLRLGQPDDGNDRAGTTTREAYDRLAEGFGPGFNGPLVLAASVPEGGDGKATLARVESAVARTPDVAAVSPAQLNRSGDAATITVIPKSSPQDERTSALVERLRDNVLPAATAGHGSGGVRGRGDGDLRGSRRQDRVPPAGLHRPCCRAIGDPADGRLPLGLGATRLGGVQSALDPGRLRCGGRGVPERLGVLVARRGRRGADRLVRAALHVRDPVRPQHGLQRLPPVAHPRGVPPRRRASRQRGAGAGARGAGDPRSRRHHGLGLPRLRDRPGRRGQDDWGGTVRRDPDRRARRASDRRAGRDGPARRPCLGAAALARPVPAPNLARGRGARSGAATSARPG